MNEDAKSVLARSVYPRPSPRINADLLVYSLLAAVTFLYFASWPRAIFTPDHGIFLYEAKRILNGDLMYRDFFEVVAPLAFYLMALCYWLFGASMGTAHVSMAALHALIVVSIYAICRSLGVRRSFAIPAALAHIAIAYPALPIASAHWMGTLLTLLTLGLAARRHDYPGYRWCLGLGILIGTFVLTEHHKAVIMAAGVVLVILLDDRFSHHQDSPRKTVARLLRFVGAAVAVAGPVFLLLLITVGYERLYDALVFHSLTQYRQYNQTTWGAYSIWMPHLYVRPELMRFLPAIVPWTLAQAVWIGRRGSDRETRRPLMALGIVSAAAIGSILYAPDYTHIGQVVDVCFILVAESADAAWRLVERRLPAAWIVGAAAATYVGYAVVSQSIETLNTRRLWYPVAHATAFGQCDFSSTIEVDLIQKTRELMATARRKEIFAYPASAGMYLTTGADNPTRFQLMIPGYNRTEQFAEVLDILDQQDVLLVVRVASQSRDPKAIDLIRPYLFRHYDSVPFTSERRVPFLLYKRREGTHSVPPRSPDPGTF